MPKQKFYAIKSADGGKIVTTWDECEKLTHGVKGVLFKSFSTEAEAKAWIEGVSAPTPKGLRIYVDGSFTPTFDKAGWAFVVVENDVEVARLSGHTAFPAESRNIDGEVMASYQAMKWLEEHDKTAVICHDYEGVARWAKGEWQAKSSIAKQYVAASKPYVHRVTFEKVAAHTGVKWNELVDKLAKDAIAKAKQLADADKFTESASAEELETAIQEIAVEKTQTKKSAAKKGCVKKNASANATVTNASPAEKKPSKKAAKDFTASGDLFAGLD